MGQKLIPALFICLLGGSFPSFSQVTISQADMPKAGDTLRVSYSSDSLNPALTDSSCGGFVWDFSYLTPTSQWVRKFDSPLTFAFPFNFLFNALNTSYGEKQFTPDSLPVGGIATGDAYAFIKESSTRYKQVGTGLSINALPLPFSYTKHDTIYKFPLKCGNRDTSNAQFGLNIPGIGYYGQKIHRVNFADGNGKLITPYGTFFAMRVRSIVSIRDTLADTSGTGGFGFSRPIQYEYKWLIKGGKIPYLQVTANLIGGNLTVTQIAYRDSMRGDVMGLGVGELDDQAVLVQVYPNPVKDYLFISYSLEKSENVGVELVAVDGRKVYGAHAKQTAGEHIEILNLKEKGLTSGIYFLKIRAGSADRNFKLVVQ